MSLLTPDSGLLFWMVIVFGIVFVILAKYGFPVITRMVDERKQYIDKSLLAAREANEQLANIKADSEMILAKAHEEQARILNEAVATRVVYRGLQPAPVCYICAAAFAWPGGGARIDGYPAAGGLSACTGGQSAGRGSAAWP